uniref:non-specific serine/threonine protein kinase n=1 Tax=Oryza rufipogon TaxID=4529 RepID=A0A0E0NNJ6_ORYRU
MALFMNLRYLNLYRNDLRTQLPPELGLLHNLTVLDLHSSGLYGTMPSDLSLGHNSLTGPILVGISELNKLEILRLEYNNLSGIESLLAVNVSHNRLVGRLPASGSLLAVNVSHNRLVGRLPASGVFQSLDASALEGNLGIYPAQHIGAAEGQRRRDDSGERAGEHRVKLDQVQQACHGQYGDVWAGEQPPPFRGLRGRRDALLSKATEIGRGVFGTVYHASVGEGRVHYNVKPSNILLDEQCNPMIGDFWLARLLPKLDKHLDKHVMSSRFQDGMGNVAAELACQSLRINEKCDIYGVFGVLILELANRLHKYIANGALGPRRKEDSGSRFSNILHHIN